MVFHKVYFRIDHERAFLAHIHSYKRQRNVNCYFTTEEGEQIHDQVLEKLKTHAAANGWDATQVNVGSLRLACGWPENQNFCIRSAGVWVIAAIERFLSASKRAHSDYICTGFIVEHARGTLMEKFANHGRSRSEKLCGDAILEVGFDDWVFSV